mmetsp:Transcript_31117/g.45963  ORF Transcript_31117/g.45963 Transcript_31117/m.45963 type:complete len:994 (+) Transcript_31117:134-3115(+)
MSSPPAPQNNFANTSSTAATAAPTAAVPAALTDDVVLKYLRQKGLTNAALELTQHLSSTQQQKEQPTRREQLERDESEAKSSRTTLVRATGGGFGYDIDSGAQIPQWGVPDSSIGSTPSSADMGVDEARAYVNSFVELQLWVLSLPEEGGFVVFQDDLKAQILEKLRKPNDTCGVAMSTTDEDKNDSDNKKSNETESLNVSNKTSQNVVPSQSVPRDSPSIPSMKPELLSVTFALLVHTYCELLEVGMETTAKSILTAFSPFYSPDYDQELDDLRKCNTTENIVRLNSYNSSHLEQLARLKSIQVQVGTYELRKEELLQQQRSSSASSDYQKQKQNVAELDNTIKTLKQKYEEVAEVATSNYQKTQDLPFLRRVRAVRWQLTLSAASYSLLAAMFSRSSRLLPMNTLLLSKCEVHVEHRDPLPQLPACVLLEPDYDKDKTDINDKKRKGMKENIDWAAPISKEARRLEAGEETVDAESISRELPFPPVYLEEEYDTLEDGEKSKRKVEFNRALLQNGFRRLEAIERKQEYEVGLFKASSERSKASNGNITENESPELTVNPQKPSILISTLCASSSAGVAPCTRSSNTSKSAMVDDAASIWEESGIGISCAKLCPPDGRRIAAGCDDAAVRIFSIISCSEEEDVKETSMVLLGHKNGFPVFDVDWNRDGRTLLSAGGDGSIRLWDTMVQGTFGSVAKSVSSSTINNKNFESQKSTQQQQRRKSNTSTNNSNSISNVEADAPKAPEPNQDDVVPVARPEPPAASGAALAVYRGHSPHCPVWSVAFSPSGYYFASAAADGTARLWVTDRVTPVRVFAGHTRASVNCVAWHPNANYILTGCDDQTARLWDIHSGQCVRLFRGCRAGVSKTTISPSGRYAAAADDTGTIHIWDLGSGQKCHEFRHHHPAVPPKQSLPQQIHALAYSACGTTLAAGGDDCHVSIWNVRSQQVKLHQQQLPVHTFPTRRTVVMDLKYTKRNLLLSVGKYTTPVVPLVCD